MSEELEDDVELMLDTCEEQDNRLSGWEREFIDGCQVALSKADLSPNQLEKLVEIYNRVKIRG